MLALLRTALRCGTPAAVCYQLAYSTTSRAFELLCATCEERGLVFVDSSKSAVGAVFYDRDPTWQHEIVSGALSRDVFMQMGRTGEGCFQYIALVPMNQTITDLSFCCDS